MNMAIHKYISGLLLNDSDAMEYVREDARYWELYTPYMHYRAIKDFVEHKAEEIKKKPRGMFFRITDDDIAYVYACLVRNYQKEK